uniref:HEPN domain-containing protein n=1 Tax=Macrostomum lignano TaxID=282301 RepID=A0A1I8JMU3_9PLAT
MALKRAAAIFKERHLQEGDCPFRRFMGGTGRHAQFQGLGHSHRSLAEKVLRISSTIVEELRKQRRV